MFQDLIDSFMEALGVFAAEYAPRLVGALLLLIVGFSVIGRITQGLTRFIQRQQRFTPEVTSFFSSMISVGLRVMLLLSAAGILGIETTSFMAVLGAAGLAVGLALQGSLANVAGGVLILTLRPFKVGDYIQAEGQEGFVDAVNLLATTLKTPDLRAIYLPNGPLAGGTIVNFSALGIRRVDLEFTFDQDYHLPALKAAVQKTLGSHPDVLQSHAPGFDVLEISNAGVRVGVRPFVSAANYDAARASILEAMVAAFEHEKIDLALPAKISVMRFPGQS